MRTPKAISLLLTVALALAPSPSTWADAALSSKAGGQPSPCTKPITYRVTSVDREYEIGRQRVERIVAKAASIWEQAAGKSLFKPVNHDPELQIRLTFGAIQAHMQDRQALRKRIKAAEKDYKRRHQSLNERIEQLQKEQKIHEQQVDNYQQRQRDFKAKVERWSRGQAKGYEITRDELLATEQNLRKEAEKLNQRARKINSYARRLRRKQRQLNALHEALNTQIDRFNRSSELFSGFQAGLYEGRGRIGRITIFQFQDERQLRTIIAHELGHALGIGHVPGSDSIMHKHMSDKNRYPTSLSTHDLDALREQCRISAPPRANARRAKPRQNPLPKGPE